MPQDVTEQKSLETALKQSAKKLRYLTSQIFTTQETERRRLSLELHDELGQSSPPSSCSSVHRQQAPEGPAQLKQECSQMPRIYQ